MAIRPSMASLRVLWSYVLASGHTCQYSPVHIKAKASMASLTVVVFFCMCSRLVIRTSTVLCTYKQWRFSLMWLAVFNIRPSMASLRFCLLLYVLAAGHTRCLLYTSDAADE